MTMEWDSSNNPTFAARRGQPLTPVEILNHSKVTTRHQPNNKLMIVIFRAIIIQVIAFGALWFVIQHSSLK